MITLACTTSWFISIDTCWSAFWQALLIRCYRQQHTKSACINVVKSRLRSSRLFLSCKPWKKYLLLLQKQKNSHGSGVLHEWLKILNSTVIHYLAASAPERLESELWYPPSSSTIGNYTFRLRPSYTLILYLINWRIIPIPMRSKVFLFAGGTRKDDQVQYFLPCKLIFCSMFFRSSFSFGLRWKYHFLSITIKLWGKFLIMHVRQFFLAYQETKRFKSPQQHVPIFMFSSSHYISHVDEQIRGNVIAETSRSVRF